MAAVTGQLREADLGPFFERCAEAGAKHGQALEAHAFACLFGTGDQHKTTP